MEDSYPELERQEFRGINLKKSLPMCTLSMIKHWINAVVLQLMIFMLYTGPTPWAVRLQHDPPQSCSETDKNNN